MNLTNRELDLLAHLRGKGYPQQNDCIPKRRKVKGEYVSYFPDSVHSVQLRNKADYVDMLNKRIVQVRGYLKRGTANAPFWSNEILLIEGLLVKLE
jgi:hypothetical protein